MSGKSEIQWTDRVWNATVGCTRVSAGCDSCYAFALHDRRHKAWKAGNFPTAPAQYHKPFSEVQLLPQRLTDPLRWREPQKIFVDSMSDLFHADVPTEFIADVFAVMVLAHWHTFQILTKRPQRMHRLLTGDAFLNAVAQAAVDRSHQERVGRSRQAMVMRPVIEEWPPNNVWLGTSVENQEAAYRIDWLVRTPAAVRFLSCEPLLGPLDLRAWLALRSGPLVDPIRAYGGEAVRTGDPFLHWIIAGGESGPGFRAVDGAWVRDLRDQCIAAGAPFFFKQWGGRTAKAGGRELDGRTWDQLPEVAL